DEVGLYTRPQLEFADQLPERSNQAMIADLHAIQGEDGRAQVFRTLCGGRAYLAERRVQSLRERHLQFAERDSHRQSDTEKSLLDPIVQLARNAVPLLDEQLLAFGCTKPISKPTQPFNHQPLYVV